MHFIKAKNFILSITGAALLCFGVLGSDNAAALTIDPSADLPGIPMAGFPSFIFNDSGNDYSGNIDSWYSNIVYVANNGTGNGYTLYAYSVGDFTYWESTTTSYQGIDGEFRLEAQFNDDGSFNAAGTNTVSITGLIPDIGVDGSDPGDPLMQATLDAFAFQDDLVGFSIDGISCATGIINCPGTFPESVYFYTAENFPDIGSLAGDYQTTMASKTTVPIPAAAWLMLSGLGLLGAFAQRRRRTA
jgi:hypothetical protein